MASTSVILDLPVFNSDFVRCLVWHRRKNLLSLVASDMALALGISATSIPSLKTFLARCSSQSIDFDVSTRQFLMVLDSEDHVVRQKALVAPRKLFAAAASSHGPCDNSKDYSGPSGDV